MDYHEASIIGSRERQEDASAIHVRADGWGGLLAVADGLGGHEGGDVASVLAVRGFASDFLKPDRLAMRERLRRSLRAAHDALAERIKQEPALEDMGTTLVAVAITRRSLRWISLGDSLLLLLREGKLRRLNDDHSYRPMLDFLVRTGHLTAAQASNHPLRNSLQICLDGARVPEKFDCPKTAWRLQSGDRVLLASDGIETLEPTEITTLLGRGRCAAECAAGLIDAVRAKARLNQDNTTVQIAIVA
jgi:serine/threonine protein phosphatase PrpC